MLQPSNALVVAAVAASGAAGTLVDLRCRRIPNALTLGTAAIGIALGALAAALGL